MKKLLLFVTALLLTLPGVVRAASGPGEKDREAVRLAVLDYVEGIYEVNPSRVERSVHPELAKRGFFVKKGETAYTEGKMTFQQLLEVAKRFNQSGKLPKDAPKEIVILDMLDQTATVKLVADWGIDYMHLAKYEGKWLIVNVLWQVHPKSKP